MSNLFTWKCAWWYTWMIQKLSCDSIILFSSCKSCQCTEVLSYHKKFIEIKFGLIVEKQTLLQELIVSDDIYKGRDLLNSRRNFCLHIFRFKVKVPYLIASWIFCVTACSIVVINCKHDKSMWCKLQSKSLMHGSVWSNWMWQDNGNWRLACCVKLNIRFFLEFKGWCLCIYPW